MNILESIKEERQLSMNHWRYRLLHWCFSCENPRPFNTGLPSYLYSHYCPLFHLTNLIAILSPIILVAKVIFAIGFAFLMALAHIVEKIREYWPSWKSSNDTPAAEPTEEQLIEKQRDFLLSVMKKPEFWYLNFEEFWKAWHNKLDKLNKDEVEQTYNHWKAKITVALEEAKLRRERFRKYLLFWTNFSRVFIKWGLNIFYIALAAVSFYIMAHIAVPIFDFICYIIDLLVNSNPVPFFLALLKFTGLFFVSAVGLMGLLKFKLCQKFLSLAWKGMVLASPPFTLVLDMFKALYGWFKGGMDSVCEFISVFYEENCPPIKIVKEE